MAQPVLDKESCLRRLKRVLTPWKASKSAENSTTSLASMDAIVAGLVKDEEVLYSKSAAFHLWLFGYELSDTLMVITDDVVYIVCGSRKAAFLKSLEKQEEGMPQFKILVKEKDDPGTAHINTVMDAIRNSRKGKTIGMFVKDKLSGKAYEVWNKKVADSGLTVVDISVQIAFVMAPKEEKEMLFMRKSAAATCDLYKKFYYEEIMKAVDQEKKIKHSKLSDMLDNAVKDKKIISSVEKLDELETCYPSIIQSGGKYNFKFSITSEPTYIDYKVICASFGLRYKSYCSNIARTLMVNPTKVHLDAYNVAYDLEEFVIKNMTVGKKISDVYDMGIKWLEDKKPEYVDKVAKQFGFATGLEFREGSLLINAKTTQYLRKGMTFCICIGFSELKNPEGQTAAEKEFGIWLGDTIVISETGPATNLTGAARKKANQVSLVLMADGEKGDENEEDTQAENNVIPAKRSARTTVLTDRLRTEASTEERRKRHQQELAERLNDRALERLNKNKQAENEPRMRKSNVAYKNVGNFPMREDEIRELKIYVDRKNETVIFPIFGEPVPFHISILKSIVTSVEGDYTYLRVNFNHPGAAVIAGRELTVFPNPEAQFVKELTFRSSNTKEPGELSAPSSNLINTFRIVKELQKKFKTREQEEREKEGVVRQDTLLLNPAKNQPRLKDLFVRPPLSQKRISGSLEAHPNGFRYTTLRGEKVDLLYNNIKHAFFQPCEGEMIILLHFHLKNAIIYQKKKILDIQFYTEVGELTTDLGKQYHMHDRDDLASEQAERELRQKLISAFKTFTEKVEQISKGEIDFDTPFRELGFPGVPNRSTVLLQPTSTCLVNLSEWPPFVVTLDEVELVHFERVQFHIKNFDAVFVFKDYTKKVATVTAIPVNLLEHVKSWLDSCDIHFTEGIQSLNWVKIMKTIADDPKTFIKEGGWDFLEPGTDENGNAEANEVESEDDAYNPSVGSSDGSESEEDESGEDEDASDDEDEEVGSDELSSGEESGKDWDELEEEAAQADRQKSREEEQEAARMPQKRFKVGGGGGSKKMRR